MAEGIFTIQELRGVGSVTADQDPGGAGERFEWTADRISSSAQGGARACPVQGWTQGGKLVRARTDYPGGTVPTEQVISAVHRDHEFAGEWSDKWNFQGYAVAEMTRFEEMVRRGNRVRIQYQEQVFEGLIAEWEFPYRGDWCIRYHFVFSTHRRMTDPTNAPKVGSAFFQGKYIGSDPTAADAQAMVDRVMFDLFAGMDGMPRQAFSTTIADDVSDILGDIAGARNAVADAIAWPVDKAAPIVNGFRGLATQFRTVKTQSAALVEKLVDLRSDTALAYQDVKTLVDFEDWSRSARYFGRQLVGDSDRAARAMDARAEPATLRTYRPSSGESLYAIAQRFYGTPHAWTTIAKRNHLTTVTLTGDELLVIPERGS
jgi:hypothetical protein